MEPDWCPPHAYVPGKTPRHPEGLFDPLKRVDQGNPEQSIAWREGLRMLQSGYYWEAHEVLEAVWMAIPDGQPERKAVQGVIQIANAALKWRMQKPKAARRLQTIAMALLHEAGLSQGGQVMGLTAAEIDALWACCKAESCIKDAL
ncbi:DUF309 domain-containing protein [Thalassococcus lentus]|uniref:DUF309 domain-containing protein n=1 Tax=Thalassococcus lentus TaxID=1210524 RepID=A0ABT4XW43_9RHOB|nr:DUF309 domain-containing protein [Thalassococcus lentus]MDA7426028.1 DUF309 domain-containing protein [Thalassococcus lentus]